jgi:hypothetical protein
MKELLHMRTDFKKPPLQHPGTSSQLHFLISKELFCSSLI